jgi:hypothetical protein
VNRRVEGRSVGEVVFIVSNTGGGQREVLFMDCVPCTGQRVVVKKPTAAEQKERNYHPDNPARVVCGVLDGTEAQGNDGREEDKINAEKPQLKGIVLAQFLVVQGKDLFRTTIRLCSAGLEGFR